MENPLHVSASGHSNRIFFVTVSIVVCSLIIDISLSNISDLISVSTGWGFSAFIAIAFAYVVGQYFILEFVKQKSRMIRAKSPYINKLSTIITIVQYILTATIVFVILQILVNSYYYTSILIWSSSISHTIATIIMVILASKLFIWYRSSRNFILLLYGVSFIITSISIVSSLVFPAVILLDIPAKTTSPPTEREEFGHGPEQEEFGHGPEQEEFGHGPEQEEFGHGPDIRRFNPSTVLGKVQAVYVTSHIASFLLLWGSTAMLLHTYSKKLGKVKFWTIISIPIASFLSIFVFVTPYVMSYSSSDTDTIFKIIVVDALGYTLPAVISGILFGLPFWVTAKTLRYNSALKDYMIIAGAGFVLFELAIISSVILAPYPPFGLASVSIVGLSSYLILMGIYSSAISMSEDIKLRQVIRKSAVDESKLLVGTGSAQMEQKIEKKVIEIAKDRSASMTEQTGVQLSLTEQDMKQYLSTVLKEIKVLKNIDEILKKGKDILESSIEFLACSKFGGMRLVYNNYFDTYEKVMMKKYRNGEHRGIRWVTSIRDKDNADLVKVFLNVGVQIRHVKNMPPIDFAVSDKEMMATIERMEGGEIAQSLLVSNEPAYVNHFKSIFEELWKNGIDALDRIKDIEVGVDQADIEIISNPKEGIKRAWSTIGSAKEEVLILFSSASAVSSQIDKDGLQLLKEILEKRSVKIRMLVPADYDKMPTTLKEIKLTYSQISDIRSIDKSLQTRITIILVDKKECVIVESKEDAEDNSYRAAGLTTYSNSKSIVSSYISIFESFWKQTELYQQLEESNKQLKVHDKMQKEFINIAAHELRTPIQPILGLSEVLQSKIKDSEQRGLVDIISRNAKRLRRLTEDILDVTRIESQTLGLKKEKFVLNDLVLSIVEEYKKETGHEINKSNIKLLYNHIEGDNIMVYADRFRITQVISNLIDNAVRFTSEERGGTVSVNIEKKSDSCVIVSVKDSGTGIDSEIMPRLFTKFTTKSFKGTGLGLFISKNIIEAHGGKIWAENNIDGKGATVNFSIPLLEQNN
jgi:signal transduction histidine kinase